MSIPPTSVFRSDPEPAWVAPITAPGDKTPCTVKNVEGWLEVTDGLGNHASIPADVQGWFVEAAAAAVAWKDPQ